MEEVKAGDDASAIPLLLPLSPTPPPLPSPPTPAPAPPSPPPHPPASCVEGSFNSSTPCFLPVAIGVPASDRSAILPLQRIGTWCNPAAELTIELSNIKSFCNRAAIV